MLSALTTSKAANRRGRVQNRQEQEFHLFRYRTIANMTPFSKSVSSPYQMLHGRGSLEALRGASKLPRPDEMRLLHAGQGSSLFKEEFAGTAAADSAISASGLWNACAGEG